MERVLDERDYRNTSAWPNVGMEGERSMYDLHLLNLRGTKLKSVVALSTAF